MFCPKCGTKALDGATFCQKCGAKLIIGDTEQQAAASTPAGQMQSRPNNPQSDIPQKKKSRKLPIILGAVALVVVVIIVIAMNWNGKIDYEATVRAHQPFVSQGTSLTYGEVLDKYIRSPDWEVRKSGEVNYVDISGKAKGTDKDLVVTIKVVQDPSDPDLASISLESVTIDDVTTPTENDAVEFLLAMFLIHEEGYDNISDLFSETANPSETQIPNTVDVNYDGVSLSQLLYLPADGVIALLGPPVIHDEYKLAYDTIEFDLDGGRITSAESFNPEKFLISGMPLAQNRSMLPALLGEPTHEGEGGSGYEMTFDLNGYVLTIATGDKDGAAWRIFITPNNEVETGSQAEDELLYKGVSLYSFIGNQKDKVIEKLGVPVNDEWSTLSYDDIYFGYHDDTGEIYYIGVCTNVCEVNGVTLEKDRAGLVGILGEPVSEVWDESGEFQRNFVKSNWFISFSFTTDDVNEVASQWIMLWPSNALENNNATYEEYQEQSNNIDSSSPLTADGNTLSVGCLVYAKQNVFGVSVNYVRGYVTAIDNSGSVSVQWDTLLENRLWAFDECAILSDSSSPSGYSYYSSASGKQIPLAGVKFNLSANELYSNIP